MLSPNSSPGWWLQGVPCVQRNKERKGQNKQKGGKHRLIHAGVLLKHDWQTGVSHKYTPCTSICFCHPRTSWVTVWMRSIYRSESANMYRGGSRDSAGFEGSNHQIYRGLEGLGLSDIQLVWFPKFDRFTKQQQLRYTVNTRTRHTVNTRLKNIVLVLFNKCQNEASFLKSHHKVKNASSWISKWCMSNNRQRHAIDVNFFC